jgi:hypothetical protein
VAERIPLLDREATKAIISGNPAGPAVVTVDEDEETLTSNTWRAR